MMGGLDRPHKRRARVVQMQATAKQDPDRRDCEEHPESFDGANAESRSHGEKHSRHKCNAEIDNSDRADISFCWERR
jgi:hypothetical protein